jgi:glycosyltransferase involved in cell wall biosynthesis
MRAPTLTVVFSSDALGGSELFNLEFLRTARSREVTINALVPGEGSLVGELESIAERVEIVPVPSELTSLSRFEPRIGVSALPRRLRALGSYVQGLRRALARLPGPVCSFGFRSQLAVAVALPPRRRGVWVVHEVVPAGAPAQMWRLASLRASPIITYSRAAASQTALRGRDARVRAVAFELSRYAPIPEIDRVERLALVGDLVEIKNHLLAIELATRLREQGANISLLLVGREMGQGVPRGAAYAERVRRAVAATPGVELVSSSPESMPDVMARIDLLLHLSSVPESFGRVCVEAMAAARPVIAFHHGGVSELVDHARTGLLCPPGDLTSVEQALLELLRDPQRAAEMGRSARRSAIERFSARANRRDTVGDALADFAIENR